MFVQKTMTRKLITVSPDTAILDARRLMDEHKIRHLPVVDSDGKLLGIVTDRDIRSALPSLLLCDEGSGVEDRERLSRLPVSRIMTPDPMTVSPYNTLEDALLFMQKKHVGAFPVVDEKKRLVGILSIRDLLRAFVNVLGIEEPGTLLGILVEDKIGQMKRIVDAITEEPDGEEGETFGTFGQGNGDSGDDLYDKALAVVARDKKASTSYIQRRLQIGYNRAASLIERMEQEGVVSSPNHKGVREVLLPDHDER